ncbi:MAG TPA: hypothetical protein VNR39_02620 [Pseudolabrys sp.]|nr:hypothetical protein [Pseudolabrys sp.]
MAAIRQWPASRQDDAAEMLLALDRLGDHAATAEELAAVDQALAEVKRGEFSSDADVEAAFRRFRR